MSTPALQSMSQTEQVYALLMVRAAGAGNDQAFACMIASRATGAGALPAWLGLSAATFAELIAYHFPGVSPDVLAGLDDGADPLPGRLDEREDLVGVMMQNRAGESPSEVWMAQVVAAACMADDHLWHDLGLWNRRQLTELMLRNFPVLARRNVKDMKWKKFLYKQLCEAEGIYTCRAPSCEVCADYNVCFGPEE